MKKIRLRAAMVVAILMMIVGGFYYTYSSIVSNPLKGTDELVKIHVEGATFSSVIKDNKGVFRGTLLTKLYNKINDVNVNVKRGDYEVPKEISLEELIDALGSGKYNVSIKRVTIPEGYTIDKIAETLETKGVVTSEEFIEACREYELPAYIKKVDGRRYALEGYLFPDTYIFEKGMSAKKIIDMMNKRFEEVLKDVVSKSENKISENDVDKMITKASMIEREVSNNGEKYLVSSVIENRISKGMKLQIDATVLYAMGIHKDRVLYKDLETPSPYNTYYTKGLPLGPISSPGRSSIDADINPSETDYLYYMTKKGGVHKFFSTYDEFLEYKNS